MKFQIFFVIFALAIVRKTVKALNALVKLDYIKFSNDFIGTIDEDVRALYLVWSVQC